MTNKEKIESVLNIVSKTYIITGKKYLDGYFLFEMGKDSVCHFKIKKCKGWKFGIWIKENNIQVFAQYEKYIDKFKPSNSYYYSNMNFESLDFEMFKIMNNIKEIIKYPVIAKYYDSSYGDGWVSYLDALKYVIKNDFNIFKKNLLDIIILKYEYLIISLKLKLLKLKYKNIDNFKIIDKNTNGWIVSQRYRIEIEIKKYKDLDINLIGNKWINNNSKYRNFDSEIKFYNLIDG